MRFLPAILTLAVAAFLLSACRSAEPAPAAMDPDAIYRAEPTIRRADFVSPSIRGGQDGLEVVTLVIRDSQDELLDVLAPYLDLPLPIAPDVAQRLQSHGLRIIPLPLADLSGVESRLHPIGVRQREWMGWALDWREAFRGRSLTRSDRLTIDRQQVNLGPGVLRLLARCWTTPIIMPGDRGPEARAVVRLEILAQHAGTRPSRAPADPDAGLDALLPPSAVFDIRRDGQLFPGLSFEAALIPGQAYLLLALPPGTTTKSGTVPSALEVAGLQPAESATSNAPRLGPSATLAPTIGEAMLLAPSPDSEGDVRAIIALIPRAPELSPTHAQ